MVDARQVLWELEVGRCESREVGNLTRRFIAMCSSVLLMGAASSHPLINAARNADREAVRRLLQEKVDANASEADGTTALHWASYRDDGESADLLIRAGANVNAANDLGATPLWTASQNGSAAMVGRLLQAPTRTLPFCSVRRR